jgi:hypothetical protein
MEKVNSEISAKPQYDFKNLGELELDAYNPRLPKSLQGKEEKDIIEFMLLEATTLELMMAIGENDFFLGEQLLIVPKVNSEGFIVVEGNRRLTAVKLLDNPDIATVQKSKVKQIYEEAEYHPKSIPCLMFQDRDDILRYVGYKHITGIKSWRLLERGRHLFHLAEEMEEESFAKNCRELAKAIGSRKDYVERLLIAYQLYIKLEENKFYGIKDIDDTNFHLNYYVDSLRRSNIVNFLGLDLTSNNPLQNLSIDNFKELSFWFFKRNDQGITRAKGSSEDLGKLDAILSKESSLKAFREGMSLQEAFELTDELDNIFEREVKKSIASLENADRVIHKVSDFYTGLKDDLITIRKLTTKIKDFRESIDKDDDEF